MTEMGQSRHTERAAATSALASRADIWLQHNICRNGPKTDSWTATKSIKITALDFFLVSPEPYFKFPFLNCVVAPERPDTVRVFRELQ